MEGLGNLSELTELRIWWSPCAAELNDTERYEQFCLLDLQTERAPVPVYTWQ
jgi:hypothetical protein